eukprot:956696-Alexandrium_andersonii.AAC.1
MSLLSTVEAVAAPREGMATAGCVATALAAFAAEAPSLIRRLERLGRELQHVVEHLIDPAPDRVAGVLVVSIVLRQVVLADLFSRRFFCRVASREVRGAAT